MKVQATANTERVGVSFVQLAFEQMGLIFREQPVSDYGIDAHVEMVKDDKATGQLVAVQIKSGTSWFNEKSENGVVFREDMAHLDYWLNHSLSVIIILYNPETETAYWQFVNDDNITVTGKGWKIEIPFNQTVKEKFKGIFESLVGESISSKGVYTILSLRDVSHGNAKRYSANILVPEASNKTEIFQIIREVIGDLKHREYYRNNTVKCRWENKPAQVIFLFIYCTLDDVRTTNWIFRSLWIDENLPSQYSPFRHEGEDIGANIVVERSQHYEMMRRIRGQYSLNKEAYLAELETILKSVEVILEKAIKLFNNYDSDDLNNEAYIQEMKELEPKLTELYILSGDVGLAPLECKDLSERFQSLMADAHNIVLPFSESGLKTWKEGNRRYLVKRAIKDYKHDKIRLGFELEKVH